MKPGPFNLTEIEIEPLSDVAWQRVEKNLMAALDRDAQTATRVDPRAGRRHGARTAWIAAGSLTAAAAIVVLVVARGDDASMAGPRDTSRIVTTAAASSVAIGDVGLTVAPDSAVLVDDERERGVLVVLERGSVECDVAPRGERPPLTVQAGDVRVEVVGTRFAVSREGDRAQVVVYEGVVKVVSHGQVARVAAGQRWPAARGATASAAAADAPAELSLPPDRLDHPAATRHHASGRDHRAASATAAPPSDKERYEAAARLEASDPDAARAIYLQLSRANGAWAQNALFAMARLEDELGNRGEAQRHLRAYLDRFPTGANAADARVLLDTLR